jgi:hypothetical protein
LPAPNKTVISMQFTDGLQEREIWEIGALVGKERNKNVLARADTAKSVVLNVGLRVELSKGLHPLHADVCGWPTEKDEQKAIALELCAGATLQLCPTYS